MSAIRPDRLHTAVFTATMILASLAAPAAARAEGAVYVMTNASAANEIIVFERDDDGLLTRGETVATGGRGSGGGIDPLGSQGALILSQDERFLYAVNARSNTVSAFEATAGGLAPIDLVSSGGAFPVSLTQHGNRLYVLNADTPNIRGFKVRDDGTLRRFGSSKRALESLVTGDGRASHPTQVAFDPERRWLVVTDLDTDEIHVFGVNRKGRPTPDAVISPSAGHGPFGFAFARGEYLVVSEITGSDPPGTPFAGSVSSYEIADDRSLVTIESSVPTFQGATCWVIDDTGRFVYTTNTSSGNLSAFLVRRKGALRRKPGNGVAFQLPGTLPLPIDLARTADGTFIYTLNTGTGTVGMFRRDRRSGALTFLGEIGGLPMRAGLQGIAAR